jgi:glucose/arabinose dehydrogenase
MLLSRRFQLLLLSLLTLSGWPLFAKDLPALTGNFYQAQVAGFLDRPWTAVQVPNGEWLITERSGRIIKILLDGTKDSYTLKIDDLYDKGQGGLLDLALTKDFSSTKKVLLTYVEGTDDNNTLVVASAVLDVYSPIVTPILKITPSRNTPVHYGGRLAALPDGTWLVTSGDGFDFREQAQQLSSQLGKTLRFNEDGSVPSNNPFIVNSKANPYLYTLGHRNPQGLAINETNQQVWLLEHGPAGGDEVNLLEAGENYGWPVATLGVDYSGARISPFTEYPGMVSPTVNWTPSIAPSAMTFYQHTLFPALQGQLLVASLKEQALFALALDQNPIPQYKIFATIDERLRDVVVGNDGAIYVLTDGERARFLRFTPIAGNVIN